MAKKILGWIIFILIAVFIGFIVWLFFFDKEPEPSNFRPTSRGDDFFPVDTTNNLGREESAYQQQRTNNINGAGRNFIPRLRHLSTVPTAGAAAFERRAGSSETFVTEEGIEEESASSITVFRYIERATGHLYETRENTLTQTRLSNTTIPKVQKATFAPDGEHVLLQMIDEDQETIESLSATISTKSTTSPETFRLVADGYSIEGSFLSPNAIDVEITRNGLTYLVPNNEGGSSLITSDFNDLSKSLIFESPLKEWLIQRVNSSSISITSKADSRVAGYSYLINANSKASVGLVGGIEGLTTLVSPNNKWVLYSTNRENELDLFSLNTSTGEVKNLGLETLPEKCIFSSQSSTIVFCAAPTQSERVPYPETWYQGLTSFNDNLWRINLETEEYDQILGDQEEVNQSFDITNLVISPKDEFILFINKKDLTLWSLDVTTVER